MKKFLSLIAVVCSVVVLTGCGNKTIVCDGSLTESGVTADVKVTGDFAGSKMTKQTIEMEFDLTDYLQYADIDDYYESFQTQYAQFEEYEGISIDVTKGDNSIIVVMIVDLDKVDENTYKQLGIGNGELEVSTKAFIDDFTDMGFTCK